MISSCHVWTRYNTPRRLHTAGAPVRLTHDNRDTAEPWKRRDQSGVGFIHNVSLILCLDAIRIRLERVPTSGRATLRRSGQGLSRPNVATHEREDGLACTLALDESQGAEAQEERDDHRHDDRDDNANR